MKRCYNQGNYYKGKHLIAYGFINQFIIIMAGSMVAHMALRDLHPDLQAGRQAGRENKRD